MKNNLPHSSHVEPSVNKNGGQQQVIKQSASYLSVRPMYVGGGEGSIIYKLNRNSVILIIVTVNELLFGDRHTMDCPLTIFIPIINMGKGLSYGKGP